MAVVNEQLNKMIAPAVAALGYELLGCEYIPQGRRSILRVYIDAPQGITLSDCESASRQISAVLDVEDAVIGQYHLEVSSPGIERPLFTLAHYQRFMGAKIQVRLRTPLENARRHITGILQKIIDDKIYLVVDDQEYVIAFNNIQKGYIKK